MRKELSGDLTVDFTVMEKLKFVHNTRKGMLATVHFRTRKNLRRSVALQAVASAPNATQVATLRNLRVKPGQPADYS
jgi:hypothetical protein